MKLNIRFNTPQPLNITPHYHREVQGIIYNNLSNGDFVHNVGFDDGGKSYKLFTFSSLMGKRQFDREKKTLVFYDEIQLKVASIMNSFLSDLATNLLLNSDITLFDQQLKTTQVSLEKENVQSSTVLVRAASPIVTYTTFYRRDGKKITHYFHPKDEAFQSFIEEGLIKKYEAYYDAKLPADRRFLIVPHSLNPTDKVVTRYKGTVITGWKGLYRMEADPELIDFALAVGLGSKCSQGFGCLELKKEFPKGEEANAD